MSLNIQKGNMYGFVTHTWNAIKGKCLHDCDYCYMKRFPQNSLRFDKSELKTDLGENNFIFVGSSCDMFADDVHSDYIIDILRYCDNFDNKYLFQSKNPKRMIEFEKYFPKDSVLATTIETNRKGFNYSAPSVQERLKYISIAKFKTMITIEPVLDFDLKEFVEIIQNSFCDMVSIGANTSQIKLQEPSKEKVLILISELENKTKLIIKPNLKRIIGDFK